MPQLHRPRASTGRLSRPYRFLGLRGSRAYTPTLAQQGSQHAQNRPREAYAVGSQGWGIVVARLIACVALLLLSMSTWADDPVIRLRKVRSLECSFAGIAAPKMDSRRPAADRSPLSGGTIFDAIDTFRKTARRVAGDGEGDLRAAWQGGALWFTERTPDGTLTVTTVLPQYREGSEDFVAIESHQSHLGAPLPGEYASGTCKVIANW